MMKKMSRILSVFLALAMLCSLCAITPVFAEDPAAGGSAAGTTPAVQAEDGSSDGASQPPAAATATPTPVATAEPTPVPEPTPEPLSGGVSGVTYESYAIGSGSGNDFVSTTSVPMYTTDLTIRVYFSYQSASGGGASMTAGNFVQQSGGTQLYKVSEGRGYAEFTGLKFNGPGNGFGFSIAELANQNIAVVECQLPQVTPAPTAEPTPEPSPTPVPKTPGLILKESKFGGTSVAAGEPFDLTLTIYATDGGENLGDVMVTLGINDENVTLANGNLNVYLGDMAPGSTRQVTYKILPGANFTGGVAKFSVALSGKGKKTGAAPTTDGSTTVSVPVTQPDRFEITGLEAPETIMVGEEGYLSLSFVNKGKMQINNLSAELKGNMANPGQSQYLGNLAAGTENSVDFSLMGSEAGTIEGTIVLSYEDAQGEVVTLEKTFSCTVEESMGGGDMWMDPSMDPTMGMDVEEPSGGVPVFVWIILAVVVIGGGAAAVIIVRKKKAAKLAQLEDSDEDI